MSLDVQSVHNDDHQSRYVYASFGNYVIRSRRALLPSTLVPSNNPDVNLKCPNGRFNGVRASGQDYQRPLRNWYSNDRKLHCFWLGMDRLASAPGSPAGPGTTTHTFGKTVPGNWFQETSAASYKVYNGLSSDSPYGNYVLIKKKKVTIPPSASSSVVLGACLWKDEEGVLWCKAIVSNIPSVELGETPYIKAWAFKVSDPSVYYVHNIGNCGLVALQVLTRSVRWNGSGTQCLFCGAAIAGVTYPGYGTGLGDSFLFTNRGVWDADASGGSYNVGTVSAMTVFTWTDPSVAPVTSVYDPRSVLADPLDVHNRHNDGGSGVGSYSSSEYWLSRFCMVGQADWVDDVIAFVYFEIWAELDMEENWTTASEIDYWGDEITYRPSHVQTRTDTMVVDIKVHSPAGSLTLATSTWSGTQGFSYANHLELVDPDNLPLGYERKCDHSTGYRTENPGVMWGLSYADVRNGLYVIGSVTGGVFEYNSEWDGADTINQLSTMTATTPVGWRLSFKGVTTDIPATGLFSAPFGNALASSTPVTVSNSNPSAPGTGTAVDSEEDHSATAGWGYVTAYTYNLESAQIGAAVSATGDTAVVTVVANAIDLTDYAATWRGVSKVAVIPEGGSPVWANLENDAYHYNSPFLMFD